MCLSCKYRLFLVLWISSLTLELGQLFLPSWGVSEFLIPWGSKLPIHILGLWAICLSPQCWTFSLQWLPTTMQADNAMAVAYSYYQRVTSSCAAQERRTWFWSENSRADCCARSLSRMIADRLPQLTTAAPGEETTFTQRFFRSLLQGMGWGWLPDVNLLTSRLYIKLDKFGTRSRDPQSFFLNALVTTGSSLPDLRLFLQ